MARPKDIPHQPAVHAVVRSTFGVLGAIAAVGCTTLPHAPAERALYVDARKALHGESRLGWTVDRVELEEAAVQVEPSACQVLPEQRAALRRWVDTQIAAEGGPAEAQYRAGKERDALDDVIDLERVKGVLDEVEKHMPADCPFWVEPRRDFEGVHSTMHRFVLVAESMGGGTLLLTKGERPRAGGGGMARVLLSYGLSPSLQVAAGLEAGGDAMLEENAEGKLSPAGGFRFGAPAWLRFIDIDRIYDIELAATTRVDDGSLGPWGGRVAIAGGVTGLRRLGFMPALQVWLGYELFPEQNHSPTQHAIRLGTRVSLDFDP